MCIGGARASYPRANNRAPGTPDEKTLFRGILDWNRVCMLCINFVHFIFSPCAWFFMRLYGMRLSLPSRLLRYISISLQVG
jgi:hypothetical protein